MIAIVITGVEFNCMEQKSQSKFLPWPEFEPRTSHLTVQHAARPLLRIFGSYHLCFYCQFVCQKILSSAIISCPKLFTTFPVVSNRTLPQFVLMARVYH